MRRQYDDSLFVDEGFHKNMKRLAVIQQNESDLVGLLSLYW